MASTAIYTRGDATARPATALRHWYRRHMTREEAIAEAQRRQRSHPDAKWLATEHDGEWVLARIGVSPLGTRPTGTATKPPPVTPQPDPQSPLQRVTTLYG